MGAIGAFTVYSDSEEGLQATRDVTALMDAWGDGPERFQRQMSLLVEDLTNQLAEGITEFFTLTYQKREKATHRLRMLLTELSTVAGVGVLVAAGTSGESYAAMLQAVQSEVRRNQEAVRQRAILAGARPAQLP